MPGTACADARAAAQLTAWREDHSALRTPLPGPPPT
ncbi:hypothetical protein QF035_010793 [Streptomyces umbrinus]|uniref:Uncharacterized protein n=1 Tax=Streptomyces umbrinus TaxID=67370 RepID=A0ABU0TBL2_9ACTN|nr:hypothetical protein [Streptomyces umbrinus]